MIVGEAGEHLGDLRQREADLLRGTDHGQPAQDVAVVPALAAAGSGCGDEAVTLVEAHPAAPTRAAPDEPHGAHPRTGL
jgi:hypothetical protein